MLLPANICANLDTEGIQILHSSMIFVLVGSVLPVQGLGCKGEENAYAEQCLDIGSMDTDSAIWFGEFSVWNDCLRYARTGK